MSTDGAQRFSQTYADSGHIYAVPDDTDAGLTGSDDPLRLGIGDTLEIDGLHATVTGDSAATIVLDSSFAAIGVAGGQTTVQSGAGKQFTGTGSITTAAATMITIAGGGNCKIENDGAAQVAIAAGGTALITAPVTSVPSSMTFPTIYVSDVLRAQGAPIPFFTA